jgi:hypothetical protein
MQQATGRQILKNAFLNASINRQARLLECSSIPAANRITTPSSLIIFIKTYSAMQMAALSAAQDVNVQLLQEHETRLSVNTRSMALINSTVLRMGKKVAKLSNTLGTDELILQLGFTLDSFFEDSTRILRDECIGRQPFVARFC